MKKILVFGKNGEVEKEIFTAGEYQKKRPPIIEASFEGVVNTPLQTFTLLEREGEKEFFQNIDSIYLFYGETIGFGHYGDVISVIESRYADAVQYIVTSIAHLAFPKGILTADLVPVFVDNDNNKFFVGITIGQGKYKGEPALIGGHLDLNGYHFETPAEALVHEAKDEAGIIFTPTIEIEEEMVRIPFLEKISVSVKFGKKTYPAELKILRTYRTSAGERIDKLGRKRVDWTTAYYLVVNVDFPLDKKKIASLLKAGDDAGSLMIVKLGVDDIPKFVFGHHKEIFLDAINKF